FRAWFYFNLVRKYGDVPWYSSVIDPELIEQLQKARTPRNVVVDNIVDDLDKAIKYLKLRTEVGNTLLNKEAALAFTSRVALFEGTWQKYHNGTPFATDGAQPDKYVEKCAEAARKHVQGAYTQGLYQECN